MAKKSVVRSDQPSLYSGQKLYFATNRANVLPVLSSALIRPLGAYEKYYDDLLKFCPGQVPLWVGSVPRAALPLLTGGREALYPVVLELDGRSFSLAARLDNDSRVMSPSDSGMARCALVAGPIPISSVRCMHFLRREDVEDFAARDFDNVLSQVLKAEVTPGLFTGEDEGHGAITTGLESFPRIAEDPVWYRRLDAAMGAVAVLSWLLPASAPWVNALARVVSGGGLPSGKKSTGTDDVSGWIENIVGLLFADDLSVPGSAGVDDRLALATIRVLRGMSAKDGWPEERIIAEIADQANAGATEPVRAEVELWRSFATAVVRNERQIGSLEDSGSIVRRALLLLMLKQEPARIAHSSQSSLRPGPGVLAVAGTLAGLFFGYSRLSRDIKLNACPPRLLSQQAASWWPGSDRAARSGQTIRVVSGLEEPLVGKLELQLGGRAFVSRVVSPDDAMMRLYFQAKSAGYRLEFEPTSCGFLHRASAAGVPERLVHLDPGGRTLRGQATIRIWTACSGGGKKARAGVSRETALRLLAMNADPNLRCRYAVDGDSGEVLVLAHQLLETLDTPELDAHVEAVCRAAFDFEQSVDREQAAAPAVAKVRSKDKAPVAG